MDLKAFEEEVNIKSQSINIKLNKRQIEALYNYMNLLIEKNKVMNLTGITEPKEIILKHFIDSLTILKYIEKDKTVIDVGTGAGFPGIPLKISEDSLRMVLLDSLNKRINFLNEVIENNKEEKVMKFVKGMIVGSAIGVGMMVMYSEGMFNKRKMKQLAKKINVL